MFDEIIRSYPDAGGGIRDDEEDVHLSWGAWVQGSVRAGVREEVCSYRLRAGFLCGVNLFVQPVQTTRGKDKP